MNSQPESPGAAAAAIPKKRLDRLEAQVGALIEAVEVLARGIEETPMAAEHSEADEKRAARRAHELLLLVKAARQDMPGA